MVGLRNNPIFSGVIPLPLTHIFIAQIRGPRKFIWIYKIFFLYLQYQKGYKYNNQLKTQAYGYKGN